MLTRALKMYCKLCIQPLESLIFNLFIDKFLLFDSLTMALRTLVSKTNIVLIDRLTIQDFVFVQRVSHFLYASCCIL